jgi:hypothetical protein
MGTSMNADKTLAAKRRQNPPGFWRRESTSKWLSTVTVCVAFLLVFGIGAILMRATPNVSGLKTRDERSVNVVQRMQKGNGAYCQQFTYDNATGLIKDSETVLCYEAGYKSTNTATPSRSGGFLPNSK